MNQTAQILGTPDRAVAFAPQRTARRLGVCVLVAVATGALLGCGLKGPLYLPAPTPSASAGASAPTSVKP